MSPEEELDLRMSEPGEGEVLKLTVAYPESPKTFVYAAVGFDGFWYLTGVDNTARKSWDDLLSSLKRKSVEIISIQRASSWKDLLE